MNIINHEILIQFQNKINYHFNNIELLIEALSHPSLKQVRDNNWHKDYERLEFLGDTILNFIVTEILFHHFPSYDEGKLAKARSSLVCKDTLYHIGKSLEIESVIIMTYGEETSGGRSNKNNIENAIESIIAAIYLDGGIDQVRLFISNLWMDLITTTRERITDPKSALQEWSQSKSMEIPHYEVMSRIGESHSPVFTVKVSIDNLEPEYGEGKSIKEAQKSAAFKLLSRVTS